MWRWCIPVSGWNGRGRGIVCLWRKEICFVGGGRLSRKMLMAVKNGVLGWALSTARVAHVRSIILSWGEEEGVVGQNAKMQIENQVPSGHICMAAPVGHHGLVLLLPVCQMVHSGEALVCCPDLPGCHHPLCSYQLLHGHLHGPRGELSWRTKEDNKLRLIKLQYKPKWKL